MLERSGVNAIGTWRRVSRAVINYGNYFVAGGERVVE